MYDIAQLHERTLAGLNALVHYQRGTMEREDTRQAVETARIEIERVLEALSRNESS